MEYWDSYSHLRTAIMYMCSYGLMCNEEKWNGIMLDDTQHQYSHALLRW